MDSAFTVVFWLALLLGLVTIVGHGIWVLLAAMFGGNQSQAARPVSSGYCPRCGTRLEGSGCNLCHWPAPLFNQLDRTVEALSATRDQIERLCRLGLINRSAGERLLAALDDERRRFRSPTTVPATAVTEPVGIAGGDSPLSTVTPAEPALASHIAETPIMAVSSHSDDVMIAASPQPVPLTTLSPEERVRNFMASQSAAEASVPSSVDLSEERNIRIPPRARLAELLAAFMEEKNIRWGELVGGLLIICCSIALVISFWAKIAERPFLKFFVFNGVTAGLFGLGLYSAHRWKLQTTSQAVLMISVLLVPLNFLAIAAFSQDNPSNIALTIAGESVSALLFAALTYVAARRLTPTTPWLLVTGVLWPSVVQLLVRRWVDPSTDTVWLLGLGAAPLVGYSIANLLAIRRWRPTTDVTARAFEALRLLGASTFAALMPLGLLLFKTGHGESVVHDLAVLVCACGLTPLAVGLFLWRRVQGPDLGGLRTVALSIAVAGAAALVAGVALAWPMPMSMLPAALFASVVLFWIATVFELPEGHLPAVVCLTLAYLTGWLLAAGRLAWQESDSSHAIDVLVSGASGQALSALAVLLFGVAAAVKRWAGRAADGRFVAIGAGGVATIGVGLVCWFGFAVAGDPLYVTWLLALFAVATCVAAVQLRLEGVLWIGIAMLAAASVQGIVYLAGSFWPLAMPWATASATAATLLLMASAVCRLPAGPVAWRKAVRAFNQSALAASAVVLLLTAASSTGIVESAGAGPLAAHWLWLAALWLALAVMDASSLLFAAFQLALTMAAWFGVGIWLETRDWFQTAAYRWLDPWALQVEGVAISMLSLSWIALRWASKKIVVGVGIAPKQSTGRSRWLKTAVALVGSERPAVDRIVPRLVLVVLVGLGIYAAWPGVAQELAPRSHVAQAIASGGAAAQFEILGIPHLHAAGWGSWLLLAAVAIALSVEMAARRAAANVPTLILALWTACPLLASFWASEVSVASAGRWLCAGFSVLGSAALLAIRRLRPSENLSRRVYERSKFLLLLLGGVPAIATAGFVIATAAAQRLIVGPAADSLFGRIGPAASYAGPIMLIALILVAYAIAERSRGLNLAAGIVANLAATTAYLLGIADGGLHMDLSQWIRLSQLNAIVAATWALGWMGISAWRMRQRAATPWRTNWPLLAEIGIATACNVVVLAPAWLALVREPLQTQSFIAVSDIWGWSAGLLTAVAILSAGRFAPGTRNARLWLLVLIGAATLIGWTACRWDAGNWFGFHALLMCHVLIGWLIATGGQVRLFRGTSRDRTTTLSVIAMVIAVALALRALKGDPQSPQWTVGALATQAFLAIWLGWSSRRQGLLYAAAALINTTASIWWLDHVRRGAGSLDWAALLEINIAALALPVLAWLFIDSQRMRPQRDGESNEGTTNRLVPIHRLATRMALAAMGLIVVARLGLTAINTVGPGPVPLLEWLAWSATAVATIACLWDAGARGAIAGLYIAGLIAAGLLLDQLQLTSKWLWWSGNIVLAAYALATSCLWWRRDGLRAIADRLRIPRTDDSSTRSLHWLVPLNCCLVAIVVALSYGFILEFDDYALRLLAAKAALFQVATVGLLAHGERRWRLQYFALALGAIGAIALGWAGLDPATTGTMLNRAVVVAAALAVTAVVYGLGLSKLLPEGNEWLHAAKRLAPVLVVLDACSILFVLGVEGLEVLEHGHVAMAPAAIVTVALVLLGLCAACLAAAVAPGRDPLGLSERGRRAYVYAAEVVLALLFVHIRLAKPEWFHGFFERFWPLVVQAIAFVGVGVGEWFRRRRWTVIGEPLETTGALLPLLPVIGFWVLPTSLDYSLLLLAVGLLYAALSVARRSFGFGLLALAAANGSLWYFLGRQEGYRFLDHPQLWLIPPALCVLIAAHLNRRQLSAAQTTSIRYGAAITMYVSSTADIFLQGVAHAPWLPLVLGGFSLLGVFAGILLRVRAFLILGTSFLMVALLTIIWYAAVDLQQTWLWSATGIVAGVLILAVFAVFEKQRQAVLNLLERLKEWQA